MRYIRLIALVVLSIIGTYVFATAEDVSLNARDWAILYSYSMPRHPAVLSETPSWFFNFPAAPGLVGYVTTPYKASLVGYQGLTITAGVEITSGTPIFKYDTEAINTCVFPAHARPYLQHKFLNWWNEYQRWWANPIAIELKEGVVTIDVPLTPDQWSDVYGHYGDDNDKTLAGFNNTLTHMGRIGLTFGGGCFFGHGVYVQGGTARFTLTNFQLVN